MIQAISIGALSTDLNHSYNYYYYLLEQNHGRGMKALSEENCEACHKDGRRFRITKARMSDPRSNVQDILNRLLNRINNFWLRDL